MLIADTRDVLNGAGRSVPVLHAQGGSLDTYGQLLEALAGKACSVPDWIGVVTCCSAKFTESAVLIRQLQKHGIPFENKAEHCIEWKNTRKPGFILDGIEVLPAGCTHVLVLDALDVALNGDFVRCFFDYLTYDKPVLFGATRNNYPDVIIDRVHDRDWRGAFRYLNAGTAFGTREAMMVFYRMVEDAVAEYPWCEREQPLVRYVFDRCQGWVEFDWKCLVFQTMSNALVEECEGAIRVS